MLGHTLSMMIGLEPGGHILWDITNAKQMGVASNVLYATRNVQSSFTFQFVVNAMLGVDTFFFLSGFLAAHRMAAYLDKLNGRKHSSVKWVLGHYLLRLWRLTPLYMYVLAVYFFVLPQTGSGPFWALWQHQDTYTRCAEHWWTNLLYINNLYPNQFSGSLKTNLGCMGWSVQLASISDFNTRRTTGRGFLQMICNCSSSYLLLFYCIFTGMRHQVLTSSEL